MAGFFFMKNWRDIVNKIFIALTAITFIIPGFLSIDQMFPEFLYLSSLQVIITIYNLTTKEIDYIDVFKNWSIKFFLIFIIFSIGSIINATNLQLSLIELTAFFTFFLTIINSFVLFQKTNNSTRFYVILILSLLTVETSKVLLEVYKAYDFENPQIRSPYYAGFSSNVNVTSFSILFKLPILLYALNKLNAIKRKMILIFSILCFMAISSIFVCYSRGGILGLALILLIYGGYTIFFKRTYKKPILILIIFFTAYLTNYSLFINGNSDIVERATTLDLESKNSSVNYRLGYYLDAINGLLEKPFLGWGIGNWKIQSTIFSKDRSLEYQVAYHTHNDFLQVAAETGFFGGMSYLLIYMTLFYLLFKKVYENKNFNGIYFYLLLSLIVFLIDSSLNFPRARPTSIVNVSLLIAFTLSKLKMK